MEEMAESKVFHVAGGLQICRQRGVKEQVV
jgi:hypothetical protein